ncbi:hypothetical protein ACHQM5_017702 [Ranunculus cassubicifolius]
MEFSYVVNVLEQCRISPPSGSVLATSLPLTYFDLKFLPLPPVTSIFLYEYHNSKLHFTDTVLPNIKHSLSLTLQHFFPYAGNLIWPEDSIEPKILCRDGDSISFTVCETDFDFNHLVGNHPKDVNELCPLVPRLVNTSGALPLMALQVTLFPNKGICIAYTYNHAVADGRIILQFMSSWASACRLQGNESMSSLCYDRSMVTEPKENFISEYIELFKKLNITKETFNTQKDLVVTINKVLATFVLTTGDIQRIRKWILNKDPTFQLSTFVCVCAYVWACLIKARRGDDARLAEDDTLEYFALLVDFRARQEPPLPDTYFGNCLKTAIVEIKRSDLTGNHGIPIAAKLLRNAIQNANNGEKITKVDDRFYSAPNRFVSVAGYPKFAMYQPDFGWGIPKKAEVCSIAGTGAFSLIECPNQNGAVQIGVSLDKFEMDVFTSLFAKTIQGFLSN